MECFKLVKKFPNSSRSRSVSVVKCRAMNIGKLIMIEIMVNDEPLTNASFFSNFLFKEWRYSSDRRFHFASSKANQQTQGIVSQFL